MGPLTFSRNESTTSFATGWHLLSPPFAGGHDLEADDIFYNTAYDCSNGCTEIQIVNSGTGFYVEYNGEIGYEDFSFNLL